MDVLCFDIGSGGVTVARFNEKLEAAGVREVSWDFHRDAMGRATLSAEDIDSAIEHLARVSLDGPPIAAVAIGSFMHSFLVLSSCCAPLTPVYTWMDTTASQGIEKIRNRLGADFHRRTGCHYHPMFPVFKLAANPPGRGNRVASPKALLAQQLTGEFVDDFGMASASGLLDLQSGKWSAEILSALGIEKEDLPHVVNPYEAIGKVLQPASEKYGIPAGVVVVSGSGDGFLANIGSGCAVSDRIAVTLGTSGVVRQMVSKPTVNSEVGTFCYRATSDAFLLGCASSNGGNALDWARSVFGVPEKAVEDPPIFLPWLNGERSIEWNPELLASWHDVAARHMPADLYWAVAEGVMFNLAQYVEVIRRESGVTGAEIILSGNGFLDRALAPILAALVSEDVLLPQSSGLASLRGAAVYAWRALGHDATPAMERLLDDGERIRPASTPGLRQRFERFKELR